MLPAIGQRFRGGQTAQAPKPLPWLRPQPPILPQGREEFEYSQTSPNEDFAESYRLFISNPEELYAKAPTKFLILNALSGRFSEAEVKERFGIDAPN